jgi:hypothetical protein
MARFAFAVPVLPGKEARAVADMMRPRKDEYEESRGRRGITMERAYEMATPMGNFVIAYIESENDFEQAMGGMGASDLPIDRDFTAALLDIHGVDLTQPPPGPPPETIADWHDPQVKERRQGMAFVAPLLPGRTDAGRAFTREAFESRSAEYEESRRAKGVNAEVVTLNSTPHGDLICVYIEATDPAQANAELASSQSAYDRWFKDQLRTLFPPEVDFDQPVPPVQVIWDWHRAPVTA